MSESIIQLETKMLSLADPRIMVAVTFHYRFPRLEYLYDTVRTICQYPVRSVEFHIMTNTSDAEELASINDILAEVEYTFPSGAGYSRSISVHTCKDLAHPQHLTWSHKPLIRERFLPGDYTHFIYTEDDHQVSYGNFAYFLKYRERLSLHRLIPGFVRTELKLDEMKLYSSDQIQKNELQHKKHLEIDGVKFVTLENPYSGMFIIDRDLASEYVASRSFDMETSKEVYGWEVSERSAMGLTFENAPDGFWVRTAVPVSDKRRILGMACIRHLPGNYANNPDSPLAKIKMADVVSP